ncbi:MAG: hypothetical protein FH751_09195 [Firmicutes bacterium]|nr:hypothetical protein [Bacillota bacterium]
MNNIDVFIQFISIVSLFIISLHNMIISSNKGYSTDYTIINLIVFYLISFSLIYDLIDKTAFDAIGIISVVIFILIFFTYYILKQRTYIVYDTSPSDLLGYLTKLFDKYNINYKIDKYNNNNTISIENTNTKISIDDTYYKNNCNIKISYPKGLSNYKDIKKDIKLIIEENNNFKFRGSFLVLFSLVALIFLYKVLV